MCVCEGSGAGGRVLERRGEGAGGPWHPMLSWKDSSQDGRGGRRRGGEVARWRGGEGVRM